MRLPCRVRVTAWPVAVAPQSTVEVVRTALGPRSSLSPGELRGIGEMPEAPAPGAETPLDSSAPRSAPTPSTQMTAGLASPYDESGAGRVVQPSSISEGLTTPIGLRGTASTGENIRMNVPNVLISANGPLPAKASFYCAGSTQVFLVSGSAWTKTASTWIGMNILIDGNNVGTASHYANEAWSHKAVVEDPVVLHLTPGSHTIELTLLNNTTTTDGNDLYRVLLFDLG